MSQPPKDAKSSENLDAFGKIPGISTQEMDKDREASVDAKEDINEQPACKKDVGFTD